MCYRGICSERGKRVEDDEAYEYALNEVMNNKEVQAEFVEWFFSGNWIREESLVECTN